MNKRHLHHVWTRLRPVKPLFFLLPAVLFAVVGLFALRANSTHMGELRDQVFAADKSNNDVQGALKNLQAYVTAHMNTSLSASNNVYPPIQLQYTYQRLVQDSGSQLQTSNGDLYTAAQAYCQAQNSTDFSGRNRVPCIQQYVQDHGSKTSLASQVSKSLYQFDFVAPKWSPDLAGWSLLLAAVFMLLAISKTIIDIVLRRSTR